MKKIIGLGAIILVSFLAVTGCNSPSLFMKEEKTTEIKVEKDQAEQLDINLDIAYGKVDITSGADHFVEGDIIYNLANLEPKVKYKLARNKGKLTIDQPNMKNITVKKGALLNNWDLKLNNDIPIQLKVNTGASKTNMDLKGLQLKRLDVEAGVGSTTIDLGGIWKNSFDVDIQMGVGETTVILPKEIGVKMNVEKGIGSTNFKGLISEGNGIYVNEAYKNSDVTITIDVELGVGEVNFEVEE